MVEVRVLERNTNRNLDNQMGNFLGGELGRGKKGRGLECDGLSLTHYLEGMRETIRGRDRVGQRQGEKMRVCCKRGNQRTMS